MEQSDWRKAIVYKNTWNLTIKHYTIKHYTIKHYIIKHYIIKHYIIQYHPVHPYHLNIGSLRLRKVFWVAVIV